MKNDLVSLGAEKTDLVFKDPNNPQSLINMVPEAVVRAIEQLPADYLESPENQLKDVLEKKKFKPSIQDHRIRFMFWKEYDHAQLNIRKMNMVYVYSGIYSREGFSMLLRNKERTAWMLCPPTEYVIQCEEMLHYGLEQLRDILSCRHESMGGSLDPKTAAVKLEIVKMLDSRVKGAVIQTTRNVNLNMSTNKQAATPVPRIEDVDKRLKELEQALATINEPRPQIIEVSDESS